MGSFFFSVVAIIVGSYCYEGNVTVIIVLNSIAVIFIAGGGGYGYVHTGRFSCGYNNQIMWAAYDNTSKVVKIFTHMIHMMWKKSTWALC